MRVALAAVGTVLLAGAIAFLVLRGGTPGGSAGTTPAGDGAGRPEPDAALAELREEIRRAPPVRAASGEDHLADARAWVAANRPEGWPHADLESRMLAMMAALMDGEARSAGWVLGQQEIEVELIRALDADGDGRVSDDELTAFADGGLASFNPLTHPFLNPSPGPENESPGGREQREAGIAATAMQGAFAGILERVELERWDADRDGVLSAQERDAGAAATFDRMKLLPDGSIEMVEDPGQIDPAEQAAAREAIVGEFGQDYLDRLLQRQERMSTQALAQPLLQSMRIETMDPRELQSRLAQSLPPEPQASEFDGDGDGSLDSESMERYLAATEAHRAQLLELATLRDALALRLKFEHAAAESDLDGDGRLTVPEWDARLRELRAERDERLFLQSYDLDGSGRVDTGELVSYLDWYRAGSMRADVNYDGVLDGRDLEAMAGRYQSQGG
ncbi:MAG: hypothetical protein IT431_10495 [Phycisphaerales bacterium]|nr:hypothetical protein [Phycisphaerales bacterium]